MRGIGDLVKRVSLGVLVAAVAMVAMAAPLAAVDGGTPVAGVPEISGASLSAGLTLLGGGMLWLRARRRLK